MLRRRHYCLRWVFLCVALAILSIVIREAGAAEEDTVKADESPPTAQEAVPPPTAQEAVPDPDMDGFDAANEDWGSYYDPKNVFCGQFDCYKILGFDYESFGKSPPDTKVITKRYRKLSREWHPDKSKHKNAKNRFVKIARAYEVLTSNKSRKEYDFMRFDQDAYFRKYGANVLYKFAPKSDTAIVIIIIFLIANIVSWYAQKHRWQLVADRLSKAAVEDWSPSMGGSPESKQLRQQALDLKAERELEAATIEPSTSNVSTSSSSSKKKKGGKKVSGKEKKQMEQEALAPIVAELVNEMKDFGGGFHQPTWKDLFVVALVKFPFKLLSGMLWNAKYLLRRLQKKELNENEMEVLTERAVGPIVWETASDEEREKMLEQQLWIAANLEEWREEQEIKNLSAAEQKYYNKLKKKGKVE